MTTSPDTTDPDRATLERALAGYGEYELFACDPALADTAAFCAAYGFAPEDSANTIVVIGKSNPRAYSIARRIIPALGTGRPSSETATMPAFFICARASRCDWRFRPARRSGTWSDLKSGSRAREALVAPKVRW